ncbi:Vomp family autotransporter [Bartonella sp. AC66GZZY]|uniref:Vomp family autotransporter n=2 Tax=unclassified Bartonella TaxID=2645622 RepID=UPI0035CE9956
MKKKYSTPNLIKVVSLSTVMATLLSSVSPVFAAGLSIRGATVQSSNLGDVPYIYGSHGSIVFAGDDDFCGADNVKGRGGKQQEGVSDNQRITAEEQYERFVGEKTFGGRSPYGTTTEKAVWVGDGVTSNNGAYMGAPTFGSVNAIPEAFGIYSFATGCGSSATGNYSTAFGAGATTKAGGAQAFGVSALASGIASVAMGVGSEASGKSAVAIGGLATASGDSSIALGTKVKAESNYTIAIGTDAEAQASGAIAIGGRRSDRTEENNPNRKVIAKAENAIAIGTQAYAETEDSVAIGVNSQVLVKDGVAVGGGSISDRKKGTVGYDPSSNGNSTKTDIAWKSTTGAFSVGEVGGTGNGTLTRQITGVAAGSEDTDAVNVAQLKAMKDLVSGAWKLSANDANPTDVNPGSTIDFSVKDTRVGKDNLKIKRETADNKHKIEFTLSDTLKLTKVTTGQSSMSDDGFIITNGAKITIDGIDAGNQQITGVADATEDDEAVNYKQLKEVKDGFKTSWQLSVNGEDATHIGPNGAVNLQSAGRESNPNIQITKNSDNTVEFGLSDNISVKSVTAGKSVMTADGFMFTDGNGPSITVNGIDAGNQKITKVARGTEDADAVNFAQLNEIKNEMAGNSLVKWDEEKKFITIGKEKDGTKIDITGSEGDRTISGVKAAVEDNDAVNKKQLEDTIRETAESIKLNILVKQDGENAPITVGKERGGTTINIANKSGDARTISGVKAAVSPDEAVNKEQLDGQIADITDIVNNIKIDSAFAVRYDKNEDGSINYNSVTLGGDKSDGSVALLNVKDGKIADNSHDAINGSQINKISQDVAKFFGGDAAFEGGAFKGPKYSLSVIVEDGTIENANYRDVGSALKGLDGNVKSVNNRLTNVTNEFTQRFDTLSQDALLWSEEEQAFVARHGGEGNKTKSKISYLMNGEIHEESTDAINGSQINKISGDIASFFGGGTSFENGVFIGPQYNLSTVSADGKVKQKTFENVGDALTGIDANVKNVNSRLTYVDNKFDKFSQDALLWDEGKQAFVARHEKDGRKTDSKITYLLNGDITEDSTDAVNGSQLHSMGDHIANYFGGGAKYENGEWTGPKFKVSQHNADGNIVEKRYKDVANAFEGVDASITDIYNQINNVTENSLVKQEEENGSITIGAKTGGSVISIINNEGSVRIISGVSGGKITEDSTEAVNGAQLFETNGAIQDLYDNFDNISTNISNYFGGNADVVNGIAPTYTIQGNTHNDVGSAFNAVDASITDIYSQITNVTENSLVKQEGGSEGLITVGKATGGTEISLVNKDNQERTLSGVKDGELSQTSTQAVNGSQLFATNQNVNDVTGNLKKVAQNTSKYFGGSTDVLAGIEPAFLIQDKVYNNVTEAFTGVNVSITNLDNKIIEMKENNLVQQDKASNIITIGAKTAGTEINIAGYAGVARKISGVQAAEKGDEAVNKDQLDKSIKDITKDIETVTATAVLYDKNDDNSVNYGSVTLGGDKNNGPVSLRNVKNGSISENSNDAINGSQINKISADIAKFFGGGAKFINGAFEGLKYTLSAIVDGKVGKANFYNVGDALTGLDKNVQDVNQRLTNVSNEFNQKIEDFSNDALLWDDDEEAFVARHEKDGQKTKSKLKYLLDGEIAEGSTDAITGNQLYLMSNKLANYFGGGAKYENGKWTDPTFKIVQVNADGTTVEKEHHNVAEAIGGVNGGMVNINNRINDVINKVDSDVLHWNKEKGAYDANHDGQPSKIINVADGKVEKGSKDAVNGGQLWETNERITGVEKDVQHLTNRVDNISNTIADIGDTVINIDAKVDNINNRVDNIEEDAVRYDRDENGKKTNKITLAGGDASEPVLIDNVSDGKIEKGSKEAVNGGQLHDYTQEQMKIILDQSKQYTDQRVNNIKIDAIDDAVDRAKQYTDMRFDVLNYSIENVKKEARQAAAIGLAVSNLRYNDTPGKLSVGFGTGLWRSQSAFAFGAGYTSENGKYRSNISATTSGGHWGVGAGFNMTLN